MGRAIGALIDPNGTVLTPKQEAFALALAAGSSVQDAAKRHGIGRMTAYHWMNEIPALPKRVITLRAEMTKQAVGLLVANMTSAADTLGYLCRKGKTESIRLNAARAIIELGVKVRDTVEFEERLKAIEERQQQTGGSR